MAYALAFPGFTSALHFFVEWPNMPHAARLILSRPGEIDGNYYSTLDLASRKLEGAHPLAATLLSPARTRAPTATESGMRRRFLIFKQGKHFVPLVSR